LGRANAATGFIGTNTIGEIVIWGAESGGAVITHPLATGARGDLETDTGVRITLAGFGSKKSGDYGEETDEHVYN